QQLVDDVLAAGGSLRVPRAESNDGGIDYARRAQLALAHGKVPAGRRLRVKTVSRDELVIELIRDLRPKEVIEDDAARLASIVVPERVSKAHSVARQFREAMSLHEISRKELPRAVRIVHAIAVEAERRGYSVACVTVRPDSYGRSDWR